MMGCECNFLGTVIAVGGDGLWDSTVREPAVVRTLCCASPTARCVKVCNGELVSVTLLSLSEIRCPVRVLLL
jgi:hypothetical protein